jgi:pre-rRNA-processing protein TSR3
MADGDCPLLLLDASWRQAEKMRRAVGPMECRAIPSGWQTAYPRRSKTHEDPGRGLATVEALYAAFCTLGRRDDRLLAFYPWKDVFLALNAALLPAESMFS